MFDIHLYLWGLAWVFAAAAVTWLWSVVKSNVAIVDGLWSLMFLLLALVYSRAAGVVSRGGWFAAWVHGDALPLGPRSVLVLTLVAVWSLRLSIYITVRNWGHGEDRRYQAIRARNQPNFALKSLYLVFALQAVLAWVISLPLLAALVNPVHLSVLDYAGTVLWAVGFMFEAGGDWQLARFKSDPANQGKVMDQGFWRFTRHPNYFGDFCIWWGFYLIALAAGGWWSMPGPLLMSWLLMRVSGVTLLEKDIGERRPQYAEYVRRTAAFFPALPKR